MTSGISRRTLLKRSVCLSLGGMLVVMAHATAATAKVCAEEKDMDGSEQRLRASLKYTEMARDPMNSCSTCAFFQTAAEGCGTCAIFNGGPVNTKGHCDSWGAKG